MSGDLDPYLEFLQDALKARRAQIGNETLRSLHPGDEGILTNIRPQYLEGATCTFLRLKNTKLVVQLHESVGKFSAKDDLTIHRNCWRNV